MCRNSCVILQYYTYLSIPKILAVQILYVYFTEIRILDLNGFLHCVSILLTVKCVLNILEKLILTTVHYKLLICLKLYLSYI